MKKISFFILVGLFLISTASGVSAKDLYVDQNSVYGTCQNTYSRAQNDLVHPWCTITAANIAHNSSDTIYILPGEYHEEMLPKSGISNAQHTVYSGYGNREDVKILGSDPLIGWTQYSGNVYYASFDLGPKIRCSAYGSTDCWEDRSLWLEKVNSLPEVNAPGKFFYDYPASRVYVWSYSGIPSEHLIECSKRSGSDLSEYRDPPAGDPSVYFVGHLTFQNLTIMHGWTNGINLDGRINDTDIVNNIFEFNSGGGGECGNNPAAIAHQKANTGTPCGQGYEEQDMLCMKTINVIGNIMRDTGSDAGPSWPNGGFYPPYHEAAGIKFYDVRDSLIANNIFERVGKAAALKGRINNILVKNNTIHNFHEVAVDCNYRADNCKVQENIIYNDPGYWGGTTGIAWQEDEIWPTDNMTILHNTILNANIGYVMSISGADGGTQGNVIKNNIFTDLTYRAVHIDANCPGSYFESNYNIYHSPLGEVFFFMCVSPHYNLNWWQNNYRYQEQQSIEADPQFVSTDPANPDFLKLSATSPAIDTGEFIPGYHCALADDNGGAGLTGCRHWSGSAPDRGAIEYVDTGPDTTPPVRSNGQPTGTLASGTTQVTMSMNTNEAATCKYGTTPGVSYDSMSNTFSTTGGTTHSQLITGLSDGGSYAYYVRCNDLLGNKNTNDYSISFSVDTPPSCEDVTGDGTIDIIDLALVIFWQGKSSGDADWQHFDHIDVNQDGYINFGDVADVITNFGQSC